MHLLIGLIAGQKEVRRDFRAKTVEKEMNLGAEETPEDTGSARLKRSKSHEAKRRLI